MDDVIAAFAGLTTWALVRGVSLGRVERRRALVGLGGRERPGSWPRSVLERVGRSALAARLTASTLDRRLELASLEGAREAVIGSKLALAAGLALAAAGLVPFVPAGALLVPVGALLGLRLPDLVLARHARRRQSHIDRDVVGLVELLVATTRAGLGPGEAIRRSLPGLRGPLAEEVRGVVRRMDLGMPWRLALDDLVRRTEAPALRRLAAALARAQRVGTGVGATLRSVAADLRDDRRLAAEEAARRAPVKMLFPLVLLILPAFLLLTVGPVLLATIRSLQSG